MSSEPPRIAVRDLCKTFYFYRHPFHRITRWLTRGRHGTPTAFEALRGVSFDVPAGTSVGIIGVNGAGKSTLLKILTGTMEPTSGTAVLAGRIASLLELGTGFHPLFTGRQNIFYNARFLGLTDDEIRERLPEIEAFSELGDFLERPLRTYSSGMQIRLAFSVAASVDPDVLVVDEVLAVGDAYFQQKCIRRIRDFRDRGVTILFVSHDPTAVKTLCDRALLLHDGTIADDDRPAGVLERYNALIARKKADSDYFALERDATGRPRRSGTFDALVSEVELLDDRDRPARAFLAGATATLRVRVLFCQPVPQPTVGVVIRDRLGNDVWGTNTYHQHVDTGAGTAGQSLDVRFRIPLLLGPGEYSVSAAVHSLGVHLFDPYDWVDRALLFQMLAPDDRAAIGVVHLHPEVTVNPGPPLTAASALAGALGEPPDTLLVGGDGAAWLRAGWYGVEGHGADAFRWSAPDAAAVLALTGDQLWMEVGSSRPADHAPVELAVVILGREIGRLPIPAAPEWQRVHVRVPADVPRGAAHVRLRVSHGWRPAARGAAADARLLGLRVRRIWSPAG